MKRSSVPWLIVVLLISSCSYSRQLYRRSSVMDYLYPSAESAPRPNPGGVVLQLPLDIGIAFVPGLSGTQQPQAPGEWQSVVPAQTEERLLEIVSGAFRERDWVGQIHHIPSAYLTPRGGFENLGQISRMFDVDVVALVSVDQVQNSDPNELSFLYLSIIGTYTLPLDRNETRTMIDVAAFHVPSQTFLLRAPGLSRVTGHASAVKVDEALRDASRKGFEESMENVATNLDAEIEEFREAVATGRRRDVDIVTSEGGSVQHGAAVAWGDLPVAVLLIAGLLFWRRAWRW